MAFIRFLVTRSVKQILLCITQALKIQLHFHLLDLLASFCLGMAHNSGVAFSLLFSIFFAHRIRISYVLSWVRNSYLTPVILSRLSYEGCTLVV